MVMDALPTSPAPFPPPSTTLSQVLHAATPNVTKLRKWNREQRMKVLNQQENVATASSFTVPESS